jgi:hypothetical protein
MLVALGLLANPAVAVEERWNKGHFYSVSLVDGSQITLHLLTEEILIATAYGRLRVPIAEIQSIYVRCHHLEGGKPEGGPHTGLPRVRKNDLIITTRFPIVGRIEAPTLKVHSQIFGERQLRLVGTLQFRSMAVKPAAERDGLKPVQASLDWGRTILRPDPRVFEAHLADGSTIDVRLLSSTLGVSTRAGKVRLPITDIRYIDVGFRYPEGMEKQVKAAVAHLGDPRYKARIAAEKELLLLRQWGYPALRQAVQSPDLEIRRRASGLVHRLESQLPGWLLRVANDDVIITTHARIVGRIETTALKVRSPYLGSGRCQLAQTVQFRSLTAGLTSLRTLLKRVRHAIRTKQTWRSQRMGTGQHEYEEVPKGGALLVGFEVKYGTFGNSPTVTTLRPIFLTRQGELVGTTHGVPGEGIRRVVAKPGYAVGALTIKAGLGVDGMSVTFMEIRQNGLDPKHAYESYWLGGMGGGPKTKLAGSGKPVIGIFGTTADGTSTFNGLGLVTANVAQ